MFGKCATLLVLLSTGIVLPVAEAAADAFDSPALILSIESFLAARGFSPGKVDGVVTGQTRESIRVYQSIAGLPVSGFVDQALVDHVKQVNENAPGASKKSSGSKKTAVVSKTSLDVLAAQEELKRLGYYIGGVDGLTGPVTRRAVRAFRADEGLRTGAGIDPALVSKLKATDFPGEPATQVHRRLDANTIKAVNEALKSVGLQDGESGDTYSLKTRQSVMQFVQDRGLPSGTIITESLSDRILAAAGATNEDFAGRGGAVLGDLLSDLPDYAGLAAKINYGQNFDTKAEVEMASSLLKNRQSSLQRSVRGFEQVTRSGQALCQVPIANTEAFVRDVDAYEEIVNLSLQSIQGKVQRALEETQFRKSSTTSARVHEVLKERSALLNSHALFLSNFGAETMSSVVVLQELAIDMKDMRAFTCAN